MDKMITLESPSEIDLNHHGVIQAHAGTGKTYTIENLVVKMVSQLDKKGAPLVHLQELLLVTYTDKAAGELKTRIRAGLQAAAKAEKSAELKAHLNDCVNTMHEAFIGTIHSVCNRLLMTWPFETDTPFQTQSVDDKEGIQQALRECIRQDWQASEPMGKVLQEMEKAGLSVSESDLEAVTSGALGILEESHSVLDRTLIGGLDCHKWLECHEEFAALLEHYANACEKIVGDAKFKKDYREEAVIRIAEIRAMAKNPEQANSEWIADLERIKPRVFWSKQVSDHAEQHTLAQTWEQLNLAQTETGKQVLLYDMIQKVRDRWLAIKERDGLISFQDMLGRMERATGNVDFVQGLRDRLRYGIIDEFQDTSVQQWGIFSRVFLGDSQNKLKLYIVGDPKQSIYSFQGADVRTYMSAKETVLEKYGGKLYGLRYNFRSLPQVIDGYNAILGAEKAGADWFVMDKIAYPKIDEGEAIAAPPDRECAQPEPVLTKKPVQVVLLSGAAPKQKASYVLKVIRVIQAWVGKTVFLPKGKGFEKKTLKYGDFAIVVESHGEAVPFMERFHELGLPYAKYKMEGVFESAMAHDLRVLLKALLADETHVSLRTSLLLTRFYNFHPTQIKAELDLESKGPLAKDLAKWGRMVAEQKWGALFRSIVDHTQISERLLMLEGGERHWTDLRQLCDYCVEKLTRENLGLRGMIEHLQMLADKQIKAKDDKNLHALATDRSSVKILTMHASKGLEFAVVFVVPSTSDGNLCAKAWSWVQDSKKHTVMGSSSILEGIVAQDEEWAFADWRLLGKSESDKLKEQAEVPDQRLFKLETLRKSNYPQLQKIQERRRLLYVALTRPQLALFVPAKVETIDEECYAKCEKTLDHDLTPRLLHLLEQGQVALYDEEAFLEIEEIQQDRNATVLPAGNVWAEALKNPLKTLQDRFERLQPSQLATRQTSYTQLAHSIEFDRGSEPAAERQVKGGGESILPAGADTGNALHIWLERCIGMEDLSWVDEAPEDVPEWLPQAALYQFAKEAPEVQALAQRLVISPLKDTWNLNAMGDPLGPELLRLADLAPGDRRAELEFQFAKSPAWLNGFMDMVFRVGERYYVLDWKSNRLADYSWDSVNASILEEHYDYQAHLYCHALHTYLQVLKKADYDPEKHLGGALYVYLRSYEKQDHAQPWFHKANPEQDAEFVNKLLAKFQGDKNAE